MKLPRLSLPLALAVLSVFLLPRPVLAAGANQPQPVDWQSGGVQHAYGLPDTRPNARGTLVVDSAGVTFTAKASRSSIRRDAIVAVSAGNQRMEIWGMKGRILRMAIPDGGGIAAAGFMHHRVDLLTVEFADSRGGYHGAVFLLPANAAAQALKSFAQLPAVAREPRTTVCEGGRVQPKSVLVEEPVWDETEVPAAYRALVYERLIGRLTDQMRRSDATAHIFREGESFGEGGCPQYVIHTAIAGFTPGSQVKRAVLGPVGMFVGTTQMSFDERITDATGKLDEHERIKATVRGETESLKVADNVAKSLAKHFLKSEKSFETATTARR